MPATISTAPEELTDIVQAVFQTMMHIEVAPTLDIPPPRGEMVAAAVYLTGVDQAKFRKPVVPGDQIRFEVEVVKRRPPFWKMHAKAFVESDLVCEAELTAMVTEEKAR